MYFEEWAPPEDELEKGESASQIERLGTRQKRKDDECEGKATSGKEALRLSRRIKGRLSRIRSVVLSMSVGQGSQ